MRPRCAAAFWARYSCALGVAGLLLGCALPDFAQEQAGPRGNGAGHGGGKGGDAGLGADAGSDASSGAVGGDTAGAGGSSTGNGGTSDTGQGGTSGTGQGGSGGLSNRPPQAKPDIYATLQSIPSFQGTSVLDNDKDPDRDPLSVIARNKMTSDAGGSVVLAASGSFSYQHPKLFWGEDRFDYVVTDEKGGSDSGSVTVIVEPDQIELGAVATQFGGFAINGSFNTYSGWAVAPLGLFNNDAYADLLIAAPGDAGQTGVVYVVFGKSSKNPVELTDIREGDGGGFAIVGAAARALGVADVNGDQVPDILIGAPEALASAGRVYVVFGDRNNSVNIDLATIEARKIGFVIDGVSPGDLTGSSVAGIGDLDGNPGDEFVVGVPGSSLGGTAPDAGQAYVVWGKSDAQAIKLSEFSLEHGFTLRGGAGDRVGEAVAGIGDFSGDKKPDILIGAPGDDGPGAAYVVFGTDRGTSGNVELRGLIGSGAGFALGGEPANDELGRSVSGCGDIDGDGRADILVGSSRVGRSYVVYSSVGMPYLSTNTLAAAGGGGFVIEGEFEMDGAGRSVAGVGDVDLDGIPDLLVAAPLVDSPFLENNGSAYLVYGSSRLSPVKVGHACKPENCGFSLRGVSDSDEAGWAVSAAGDVNDDGYADFVVTAPHAAPHGGSSGQSYVVFGGEFRGPEAVLSPASTSRVSRQPDYFLRR